MLKVDLTIVRCRSHAPRMSSLGIYDDPGLEKWISTSTWCRTHRWSLKWKRRTSGDTGKQRERFEDLSTGGARS